LCLPFPLSVAAIQLQPDSKTAMNSKHKPSSL